MQLRVWGVWAALVVSAVLIGRPATADHEKDEVFVPGLGEIIYHEGDIEAFGSGPDNMTFGVGVYDVFKDDPRSLEGRVEYRWGNKFLVFGPQLGVMANHDGGVHVYLGPYMDFRIGNVYFTPAFGPGFWHEGDSKDQGGVFEFHVAMDVSYRFESGSRLGVKFSHISNAYLNGSNPGSESINIVYTLPVGNMF